jgi:pimeloyl-ACP methyl ester carboxylesterase
MMANAIDRLRTRSARRALLLVLALAGILLLTQACAAYHVRRAQDARRPLGDLLYVESAGPSEALLVVFLPGMTASTTYWREAGALALADGGIRILLLDELGFGRSPWPDGEYTLEDHLGAIARTLATQGTEKDMILVGHSFGAMLAAEYGARHADEVRQVILFGTPLYRNETEARQRVAEMSTLAGMTARNARLARAMCVIHTALLPLTTRIAPLFVHRDLPPAVVADGTLHFWPSLRGSVENVVLRHSIEPALATLGSKVTFVHGRRDEITPLERIREVAGATGAAVVETDDDHVSYWRSAAELVRIRLASKG